MFKPHLVNTGQLKKKIDGGILYCSVDTFFLFIYCLNSHSSIVEWVAEW